MSKSISELVKECHQFAKDKGFWNTSNILMGTIGHEDDYVTPFAVQEITKDYSNFIISQKLMLIVSELSEALEALRNNKKSPSKLVMDEPIKGDYDTDDRHYSDNLDFFGWPKETQASWFKNKVKDTFEDELADTVIRIFDLCGYLNIDLEKHIELKMAYNQTRPNKHNKEF